MKDMAKKKKAQLGIEGQFEEKLHDVSKWVSKEIGRPSHVVAKEIKDALDEHLPHMSEKQQLRLKKHLLSFGTPILGAFLVYSYSGGQPDPLALGAISLGGAVAGFIESMGAEKKLRELERKEFERRHKIKLKNVM